MSTSCLQNRCNWCDTCLPNAVVLIRIILSFLRFSDKIVALIV